METVRIQNGQTERIEVLALDSNGSSITGLSDVLLSIRRISDGYWLDFDDNTFKNSGWTTRQQAMTEIDAANDAGKYKYDFDTSGYADDTYQMRAESASASNFPQIGELKVGGYTDNLDIAISTRSSHNDPDPNGYIDAAISSRSSHAVADIWNSISTDHEGVTNSFGYWWGKIRRYLVGHKYFDGTQIKVKSDDGLTIDQVYNIKNPEGQPYAPSGDVASEQEPT
jgi:hypothetical protein